MSSVTACYLGFQEHWMQSFMLKGPCSQCLVLFLLRWHCFSCLASSLPWKVFHRGSSCCCCPFKNSWAAGATPEETLFYLCDRCLLCFNMMTLYDAVKWSVHETKVYGLDINYIQTHCAYLAAEPILSQFQSMNKVAKSNIFAVENKITCHWLDFLQCENLLFIIVFCQYFKIYLLG